MSMITLYSRTLKKVTFTYQPLAELTKYLSNILLSYNKDKLMKLLVMHLTIMEANCSQSDIISMPEMRAGQHNLEGRQTYYLKFI